MSDKIDKNKEYLTDEKVDEILKEAEEEKTKLKSRWESEEMQIALAQVISALQLGQPWAQFLSDLPYIEEVFTGWDLRGSNPQECES